MNTRQRSAHAASSFWGAIDIGSLAHVRSSIASGQDVNAEKYGFTPLYIAASNGHREVCNALLAAGANITTLTADGVSPLFIAASQDHHEVCIALLAAGANVNVVNEDGFSPLFVAAVRYHAICVTLFATGADVNATAALNLGVTSLHMAAHKGHVTVCDALLESGASVDVLVVDKAPLSWASGSDVKFLRVRWLLVSYGASVADLPTGELASELPNYLAAIQCGAWRRRAAALAAWVELNDLADGVLSLAKRVLTARRLQ